MVAFVGGVLALAAPVGGRAQGDAVAASVEEADLDGAGLLARAARCEAEGDLSGAHRNLEAALAWFRAQDDTNGERAARVQRALCLGRQGEIGAAVEDLTAAIPLADASVDRSAPVTVRLHIAELYLEHGRPIDALPWADAALIAAAVSGRESQAEGPSLAYLRVTTALASGDDAVLGALRHIDRRLAEAGGYEGPGSLPGILFAAAAQCLAEGKLEQADAGMALAVRAADILAEPEQLPAFLTGRGYVALERGDPQTARAALERCLSLEGGRTVAALASLGAVERLEGELTAAVARYDEALELAKERREVDELGALMAHRADVLELSGDRDGSRRQRERALRQLADHGDDRDLIRQQVRLARQLSIEHRWGEAEELAMRSLGLNRVTLNVPGVQVSYLAPELAAEALLVLAAMHAGSGELDEARRELQQADLTLTRAGREVGRVAAARVALELLACDPEAAAELLPEPMQGGDRGWQLRHARARLALEAGDTAGAESHLWEAMRALDRAAEVAPWDAHPLLLPDGTEVRDSLVQLLGEAGRAGDLLALVTAPSEYRGQPEVRDRIMAAVSPDAAVLVACITAEATWLALLHDGEETVASSPIARGELVDRIAEFADLPGEGARPRRIEAWQEAGAAVNDHLLRPLADPLAALEVERLAIATDPAAASLPLAALPDGEGHLAQRYTLSRVPAGGVAAPAFQGKRRTRTAVAVQCQGGGSSWGVEVLRGRVRATRVLELADPWSDPAGEISEAAVIHIACPEGISPASPGAMAPRVAVLDLTGEGASGLGQTALDRAADLILAGAPEVLIVPAGADPSRGAALYLDLLKELDRHGAAGALRRAQLARVEDPPADWAGWTVVGW